MPAEARRLAVKPLAQGLPPYPAIHTAHLSLAEPHRDTALVAVIDFMHGHRDLGTNAQTFHFSAAPVVEFGSESEIPKPAGCDASRPVQAGDGHKGLRASGTITLYAL